MKNMIKGSFVLLLFSISVLLFQVSCQKELDAQTGTPSSQKGKLVYSKTLTSSSTPSPVEIWTCNYDGSGQQKINILLPSGFFIDGEPRISPDGQIIFFNVADATRSYIYSCKTDGTGVSRIITEGSGETFVGIGAAF